MGGNWGYNYSEEEHRPIFYIFLIVLVVWICIRATVFWFAHCNNVYAPILQRCCMRLCICFGFYSIFLLLNCYMPQQTLGFSIALYFLEGYIIYSFFSLLILWAGGRRRIKEFLHAIYTNSPLKVITQQEYSSPISTVSNNNTNSPDNSTSTERGTRKITNTFQGKENFCLRLEKSYCPGTFCFCPNVTGYFAMLEIFVLQMMFLKSIESIFLLTLDKEDDLNSFQKVDQVCRFLGIFSLVLAYTCVIRLLLIIYPHIQQAKVKTQFCLLKVLVLLLTFQGTLLTLIYTTESDREGGGVDSYISAQENGAAVAAVMGIIEIAICIDPLCRLFSYHTFEDVALGNRQLEMPIRYIKSSKESFNKIEEALYQLCLWNIWNEDNDTVERFHMESLYQRGGQSENLIAPFTVNSTNAV